MIYCVPWHMVLCSFWCSVVRCTCCCTHRQQIKRKHSNKLTCSDLTMDNNNQTKRNTHWCKSESILCCCCCCIIISRTILIAFVPKTVVIVNIVWKRNVEKFQNWFLANAKATNWCKQKKKNLIPIQVKTACYITAPATACTDTHPK